MAKLNGILKIEGTLDNLTFYKSADGHLVRTKGGVNKKRIMNDPAFIRTRENGAEFGQSANAGKMLRMATGTLVFKAKDSKLSSRLMQVMSKIKNLDTVSNRGERNVAQGITTPDGRLALKGFDFNYNAPLKGFFFSPYTVDTATGAVQISNLIPAEQIRFPAGATHFSIRSAFVNVDFATGLSEVTYSDEVNLPLDLTPASQDLLPNGVPEGIGTQVYLLFIAFYQEVNGVQYSLNNGTFNVLNIVDVV